MKKNILNRALIVSAAALMVLGEGCNKFLEVESLTKKSPELLLSSESGIMTIVADLYNSMPMEDFNYHPGVGTSNDANQGGIAMGGFGIRGVMQGAHFATTDMYTDDAIRSDGSDAGGRARPSNNYFDYAYVRIRNVNTFLQNLVPARDNGIITEATFTRLQAEAYFIRGYLYYGLVKEYGGVPIFEEPLDNIYVPGSDNEQMYVPRNTEKETWDFVLADLDRAIAGLENSYATGTLRANKMVAYALKSRVALYAASIAKYWNEAPLSGAAVTAGFVGMPASEANRYYQICIDASKAVIDSGKYSLYGTNPANREEAQQNYRDLFLAPNSEYIFWKEYLDGSRVGNQGHSYDTFYSPAQKHPGWVRFGRYSVTLDMVDAYEDYTDNGTGAGAPIVTREDGNESTYFVNPNNVQTSIPFKKYDNPLDPFVNKDVRLHASVLLPGSPFRDVTIVMQGGLVRQDGTIIAYANDSAPGKDGESYWTYGAEDPSSYSGFANLGGSFEGSHYSSTGFSILKYLSRNALTVTGGTAVSTTPWIDLRLAEIYLNYAEAYAESGQGDAGLARQYLNALRHRACHKDTIEPTLANVLKERRVELAFEGRRFDDMIRRREYHKFWNGGRRHALVPMLDLREATPKYIFVRVTQYHDETAGGRDFDPNEYYKAIPSIATNRLEQNPGH